jgi:hypothetical protein
MFAQATFAQAAHQPHALATPLTPETTLELAREVEVRHPEHRLFVEERALEVVAFARVAFAAQA